MPRAKKSKGVKQVASYGPETFEGLLDADGSRPSVRRMLLRPGASGQEKRIAKRAKESKVLDDMLRRTTNKIEEAVRNKGELVRAELNGPTTTNWASVPRVVLNFRMADFVEHRLRNKVPLEKGGPFKALADCEIKLKAKDGPRLLVDLDGVIVFFYCPDFMGKGLEVRLDGLSISASGLCQLI